MENEREVFGHAAYRAAQQQVQLLRRGWQLNGQRQEAGGMHSGHRLLEAQRLYQQDVLDRPRTLKITNLIGGSTAEDVARELDSHLGRGMQTRYGAGAPSSAVSFCRVCPPSARETAEYEAAVAGGAVLEHGCALTAPSAYAEVSLRTHELRQQLDVGLERQAFGQGKLQLRSSLGAAGRPLLVEPWTMINVRFKDNHSRQLAKCAALDLVVPGYLLALSNALPPAAAALDGGGDGGDGSSAGASDGSSSSAAVGVASGSGGSALVNSDSSGTDGGAHLVGHSEWWSTAQDVQIRVNPWARTVTFHFAARHGNATHAHQMVVNFDEFVGCGTIATVASPCNAPPLGTACAPPKDDGFFDKVFEQDFARDVLSVAPTISQAAVTPPAPVQAPAVEPIGLQLSWTLRWPPRVYHAAPPAPPAPPRRDPPASGSQSGRRGASFPNRGGSGYRAPGWGNRNSSGGGATGWTPAPAPAPPPLPWWALVDVWPLEASGPRNKPWLRAAPVGVYDFTECAALAHCQTISVVLRRDAASSADVDRLLFTLAECLLLTPFDPSRPPPSAPLGQRFDQTAWSTVVEVKEGMPIEVRWALECLLSAYRLSPEQLSAPLLALLRHHCAEQAPSGSVERLTQALYDCLEAKDTLTVPWLQARLEEQVKGPGARLSKSPGGGSSKKERADGCGLSVSVGGATVADSAVVYKDPGAGGVVMTRRVLVTPTRVVALPPERELTNRVLREFYTDTILFARVTLGEEDGSKVYMGASTTPSLTRGGKPHDTMVDVVRRFRDVLVQGFDAAGWPHKLLAFSASQLNGSSAWFMAEIPDKLEAELVRYWLGGFDEIKCVAKYSARLGQNFSASEHQVVLGEALHSEIEDVVLKDDSDPDGRANKYVFSDGVGRISLDLARHLMRQMNEPDNRPPAAIQARYCGGKGMLVPWEDPAIIPPMTVQVRPSMIKFDCLPGPIEVLKLARFTTGFLNRQFIQLLTSLGVEGRVFMQLAEGMLSVLNAALEDSAAALTLVKGYSYVQHSLAKCLESALLAGVPPTEPFLQECLQAARQHGLSDLRHKARLLVKQSGFLFGVMDETGTLEYGQVFVQVQPRDAPTPQLIQGRCFVSKNPCLHPGDVRVLECMDVPALHHLVNVVVFPCQGLRPHPNEIAGSDLDGDEYFVCWDPALVPHHHVAPMDYTPMLARLETKAFGNQEVADFFLEYQANDRLGLVDNAHLVHADREGAGSNKCKRLAKLHVTAVDYAKTGLKAELPEDLKPKEYPHFMEKSEGKSYTSTSVLGRLYDLVCAPVGMAQQPPPHQGQQRRRALAMQPLLTRHATHVRSTPTVAAAAEAEWPQPQFSTQGVNAAAAGLFAGAAAAAGIGSTSPLLLMYGTEEPGSMGGSCDVNSKGGCEVSEGEATAALAAAATAALLGADDSQAVEEDRAAAAAEADLARRVALLSVSSAASPAAVMGPLGFELGVLHGLLDGAAAGVGCASTSTSPGATDAALLVSLPLNQVAAAADTGSAQRLKAWSPSRPPAPAAVTVHSRAASASAAVGALPAVLMVSGGGGDGAAPRAAATGLAPDPAMLLDTLPGFWTEVEAVQTMCLQYNADMLRVMNRYGVLSEREVVTGWISSAVGVVGRKLSDLREPILLEVKHLRKQYSGRLRGLVTPVSSSAAGPVQGAPPLGMLRAEEEGEAGMSMSVARMVRASAAYFAAYCDEGSAALEEGARRGRGDGWQHGGTGDRHLTPCTVVGELRLLSFGWLLYEDLLAAREYKRQAAV